MLAYNIQGVPLATEPGISLIILIRRPRHSEGTLATELAELTPPDYFLWRYLKERVILISGKIIKQMPGSVTSGTHSTISDQCELFSFL